MIATQVLGAIFAALFVFEAVGFGVLQPVGSGSGELSFWGITWIFGLWVELVVLMIYLIAWVGEEPTIS